MSVFANGRSIVHAGDGGTFTALAPDVCKTPSPGGPVPVPYPNIAQSSDLDKGTKHVEIESNSVALDGANLKTSTGDEAGTAGGGVISSKTKGKMTWVSASPDVLFEGKGVIRFLEPTLHNGNSNNTNGTTNGSSGVSNELDPTVTCPHCGKPLDDKSHHAMQTDDEKLLQAANDRNNQKIPSTAKTVGGMKSGGHTVFSVAGGGDGKLFNLKTKLEIPLTKNQISKLESGGNTLGNCCEQKMLREVFVTGKQPFPPSGGVGNIKMGIAEALKGNPTAKELRHSKHKAPCKTCEKALIAMLCTNPAIEPGK